MRHHAWWLSTALLAVACQNQAQTEAQPAEGSPLRIADSYELIDLGALEGDTVSFPTAVNNNGQVTGVSVSADGTLIRAFLWDEANGMRDLGLPADYDVMFAASLNDRGTVVGTLLSTTLPTRGFISDQGELSLIEPPAGGNYSEAFGINQNGDVVGSTDFTPGGPVHAFVMRQGQLTDLGVVEGGTYSVAMGINQAGDIVGIGDKGVGVEIGLVWVNNGTRMIDLSTVLSVPDFLPYAISESSDVAGYSASLGHAVFVEPGADVVDLGSLEGPEGNSEAFDLNTEKQVVGRSSTADGREHAFLWEDGQMVDLNGRIPAEAGVELVQALSINEIGEIAAYGLVGGMQHAFLLRPNQPISGEPGDEPVGELPQ